MPKTLTGEVIAVLVGRDPKSVLKQRLPSVRLTWEGFEGDRHAGLTRRVGGSNPHYSRGAEIRNNRQVSLVSVEELAETAALLGVPCIEPEWVGANLLIGGIPSLTLLPPGTRFYFSQEAAIVNEGENFPCLTAGASVQAQYPDIPDLAVAFPKAAYHKRGLLGWVERPGIIAAGDRVEIEIPDPVIYSG